MGAKRDRSERILDLIGQTYDAALDRRLWPGLAPRIAETFGATSTAVHTRDRRHGTIDLLAMTQNFTPDLLSSYESYYAPRDVWVERALRVGPAKVVASKDLIEDRELERTEIYSDWFRHLDIFYVVGSVFPVGNDEIGVIGVHRPREAGTFEEPDKAFVGVFLPHLQRALQIRRRLDEAAIERDAALDALDRSATAALVLDQDGRVLYASAEAERLMRECDALRMQQGRLVAANRADSERLAALVRRAADTAAGRGAAGGGAMAIARQDRLPLTLLVAPFRPARDGFGPPFPTAIVFVRDPEAAAPALLLLQDLLGLTPGEARIARALAEGASLDEAATALGITINTARTQLKGAFAKTGTSRQSQLVGLVLRSVATMK